MLRLVRALSREPRQLLDVAAVVVAPCEAVAVEVLEGGMSLLEEAREPEAVALGLDVVGQGRPSPAGGVPPTISSRIRIASSPH